MRPVSWLTAVLLLTSLGCAQPARELHPALQLDGVANADYALWVCRARLAALKRQPPLKPLPIDPSQRAELFGRARGEPVVFTRPPRASALVEPLQRLRDDGRGSALVRMTRLRRQLRGRPADLRKLVLREGYLFSEDPAMARALVRTIELPDLFDEPQIWLMRGERRMRLVREKRRFGGGHEYRQAEGPDQGTRAKLLWADRVALRRPELDAPLHRDLRALRDRVGFDRLTLEHVGEHAMSATLAFGELQVHALLDSDGAELSLACLDAASAVRQRVAAWQDDNAWRRHALAGLRDAVHHAVREELPFDRPRGVTDHLSDGQLRPRWEDAYRRGQRSFTHEEQGYPVFDAEGRPSPPEMCVEMILDSYERAAGSWYRPLGQERERTPGMLDFAALGLDNRAGVLAFETFAKQHDELFVARRIPPSERIPFHERSRFFRYWLDHADAFSPGDIIAIQGPKPDGYVHQHALLIADVDPLTGFPYALADQMSRPRIRTFEDVMAEAPKRSLLYHVKPKRALLDKLVAAARRNELQRAVTGSCRLR